MKKHKLLSLDFFASKFGFSIEDLSYGFGIIEKELVEGSGKPETFFFIVILIKGKNLFIDVIDDKIFSSDIPNTNLSFQECNFSEVDDGYLFESEIGKKVLTEDEVEKFYSSRYFCDGTKKYVAWNKKNMNK